MADPLDQEKQARRRQKRLHERGLGREAEQKQRAQQRPLTPGDVGAGIGQGGLEAVVAARRERHADQHPHHGDHLRGAVPGVGRAHAKVHRGVIGRKEAGHRAHAQRQSRQRRRGPVRQGAPHQPADKPHLRRLARGRHQRRRVRKRHAQAQHQRHQHVPHRVRAVVQKARQIGKIALGSPGRVNADIAGRAQRQPVKEREGQKKHRRQRQRLQRGPAAGTGVGHAMPPWKGVREQYAGSFAPPQRARCAGRRAGRRSRKARSRAAAEGARCAGRRSRKARGRAATEGARCAGRRSRKARSHATAERARVARGGEAGRPMAAPPQSGRVARGGEAGRPVAAPPQRARVARGGEAGRPVAAPPQRARCAGRQSRKAHGRATAEGTRRALPYSS